MDGSGELLDVLFFSVDFGDRERCEFDRGPREVEPTPLSLLCLFSPPFCLPSPLLGNAFETSSVVDRCISPGNELLPLPLPRAMSASLARSSDGITISLVRELIVSGAGPMWRLALPPSLDTGWRKVAFDAMAFICEKLMVILEHARPKTIHV